MVSAAFEEVSLRKYSIVVESVVGYVDVIVVRGLAKHEYISSGHFKGCVSACLVDG